MANGLRPRDRVLEEVFSNTLSSSVAADARISIFIIEEFGVEESPNESSFRGTSALSSTGDKFVSFDFGILLVCEEVSVANGRSASWGWPW